MKHRSVFRELFDSKDSNVELSLVLTLVGAGFVLFAGGVQLYVDPKAFSLVGWTGGWGAILAGGGVGGVLSGAQRRIQTPAAAPPAGGN